MKNKEKTGKITKARKSIGLSVSPALLSGQIPTGIAYARLRKPYTVWLPFTINILDFNMHDIFNHLQKKISS